MPQELKIGSYSVYFWFNENDPLEPIHVHISEGSTSPSISCFDELVEQQKYAALKYGSKRVL